MWDRGDPGERPFGRPFGDGPVSVSAGGYRSPLPEGIDDADGGPELFEWLVGVDRTELNGHDLVRLIEARARLVAHVSAELFADIAELAYSPAGTADSPADRGQLPDEYTADEVGAALVLTRRSAETMFGLAWRLCERLPQVWEALCRGRIDVARARVIADGTDHLDPDIAREVADRIVGDAEHLTTGQVRARLRRLCVDTDPDDAARRYRSAVDGRRVVASPTPDGTGHLYGIDLPADRLAGILTRLTHLAHQHKRHHDPRSIDQLRADILMDLLDGTHPHPGDHAGDDADEGDESQRRATVDISIDLTTLIGLNDRAGDIPGWGPVIADIARQAITDQPNGEWRIVVTDPDTHAVAWNGTTRRRPTPTQRRHIHARQPTCTHPHCRAPATSSDLDHITEYQHGGPTTTINLQPLCRHHHTLKTSRRWTVHTPHPGTYHWTSPHNHTYTTHHPNRDPP